MAFNDEATIRKKKAAALLLFLQLKEHDEQLLQAQHLFLEVQMFSFLFKTNHFCRAMYAEAIQCPTTTEKWTAITEQFEKRWQLPHCCGVLDGKHVAVTCPWNTARCTETTSSSPCHHGLGRCRLQVSLD